MKDIYGKKMPFTSFKKALQNSGYSVDTNLYCYPEEDLSELIQTMKRRKENLSLSGFAYSTLQR